MPVIALAVASLAVSVGSAAASASQASKARKLGKSANAAQKALNRKRNAQARRAFLRNFQQAQAARLAEGISSGVSLESSTVQGQLSSQATQAVTAIKEFKEFDTLGGQVGDFRQAAANASSRSQTFGQVASFAKQFINFPTKKVGVVREQDMTTK